MHAVRDDSWRTIDQTIAALAVRKGELDAEIARWLLAASRASVHRRLGFASLEEYAGRRLGYDARTTREKLRVARALETLPEVRRLMESGARSWSAVREITRVATPANERAWIARTEGLTVRQIEGMVSGRKPGEGPTAPKDPLLAKHRLVFELASEEFALWSEAMRVVRETLGPGASAKDVLRAMAEIALGRRDETEPGYKTSLTVCVSCERTWRQSGGEAIEVPASAGACASCDGELAGFARVDEGVADADPADGPPASPEPAATHVGHSGETARAPSDEARADVDAAIVELVRTSGARGLVRAVSSLFGPPLRTMTPALRATVRARDQHRCAVPGCPHARFVDLHHLRPRAHGGRHEPDNITSLCTAHHRAVHEGVLAIEGTPSGGLVFRHPGGVLYGRTAHVGVGRSQVTAAASP